MLIALSKYYYISVKINNLVYFTEMVSTTQNLKYHIQILLVSEQSNSSLQKQLISLVFTDSASVKHKK